MKRQIRSHVFETNSSMTHALTICTEEEYERWQNGEVLYGKWEHDFKTLEEVEGLDDEWEREEYVSSEEYDDDYDFEHYEKHFTTPSGDKMVVFGYYGHD